MDNIENIIEFIPKIPQGIIEAANNGNLVVFIGAGVSRIVGCQGWDDLAKSLLEACYNNSLINYKVQETIRNQVRNNKELITITHKLLRDKGKENIFFDKFNEALSPKENDLEKYDIYTELIGFNALFISTNADTVFDNKFNDDMRFHKEDEITVETLKKYNFKSESKLFKIHGCQSDPQSLVFTLEQYIKRYKYKKFIKFLDEIFNRNIVLFVGYGMAEMELLDFLFTKINSTIEKKHYYLMPFYKEENKILEIRKSYYNIMSIEVIPYALDAVGHKQLYSVIKEWNNSINGSLYRLEIANLISDTISTPTDTNISKVIKEIKANENYKNILFNQLRISSNPLPWFNVLQHERYFNPKHNPRHTSWNALYVLENIAKHSTTGIPTIIDKIINHEFRLKTYKKNVNTYNYDTNITLIRIISYFKEISDLHIKFIVDNLRSIGRIDYIANTVIIYIIPNLLRAKNKDKIIKILDVLFEKDQYDFKIAFYDYEKLIETSYKELKDLFKTSFINYLIKKIEIVIHDSYFAFDINKVKKVYYPDGDNIQQLVSNTLCNLLADLKPKSIIKNLLNKKDDFFVRQALCFIDQNYNQFKTYFWKWLENDNPFNNQYEELFILFRNHYEEMDSDQITKIIELLDNVNFTRLRSEEEVMHVKKQWLVDLFNGLPKQAKNYVESLNKYDSTIPSPRDFELKFDIAIPINNIQMLPTEQFIKLSINDILLQINNKDYSYRDNSALANNLKEAIKEKPIYFINNLEKFLDTDYFFINEIFSVLTEIWQHNIPPFKQIDFSWQKVFHFISRFLKGINLKKTENSHYLNWVLDNILRLITSGMINDDHAFDQEYFTVTEKILLQMSEYKETDEIDQNTKIAQYAINTYRQKLYMTMIDYSLRKARCQDAGTKKWTESIKMFFMKKLEEKDLIAHFVLGSCMLNLFFLDEEWLKKNKQNIFSETDDRLWEWSFTGYCYSIQQLHWPIYDMLSEDYSKSLTNGFKDKEHLHIVVKHILIDNLRRQNDEKLNEVIAANDLKFIDIIIDTFNTWKRNDKEGIIKDNILIPLLAKIDKVLKKQPKDHEGTCSLLCSWIATLDLINDDIIKLFNFSLRNMKQDWHTEAVFKGLQKHIDSFPKEVIKIFNIMIDAGVYPMYDNEKIKKLVITLYEKQFIKEANIICSKFIKVGRTFLQEIFNQYQGSKP